MEIIERSYQSMSDLYSVGGLIRRAVLENPHWNAWSFTRFDIWAQRQIADELVHRKLGWQENLHLWFAASGPLLAMAALDRAPNGFVVSDPQFPELLAPAVDWIEARCAALTIPNRIVGIEAVERNTLLTGLLERRGYQRCTDFMNVRTRQLKGTPPEPVILPTGFVLRHASTRQDLIHHVTAVHKVFNMLDPEEVFRLVIQAPSYVPELNVLVMAPSGECAGFTIAWLDRGLGVAEFEPVRVLPEYQKLGLGAAMLAERRNRLRDLGCSEVHVESWSESPGANRLYELASMETQDRLYNWELPLNG